MRGILSAWSQLLGVFLVSLSSKQGVLTAHASLSGKHICTFRRLEGLRTENPVKRALEDIRKDIRELLGISAEVELVFDQNFDWVGDRDMFVITVILFTARNREVKRVKKLKNLPLRESHLLPSSAGPQTGRPTQLANAEDS